MKTIVVSMVAAAGIVMAGAAMAADMPAAGKSKCGMCHAVDKKVMGPSYMDISAKFKGDADAVSKLEAAIAKGGIMPMFQPKAWARVMPTSRRWRNTSPAWQNRLTSQSRHQRCVG